MPKDRVLFRHHYSTPHQSRALTLSRPPNPNSAEMIRSSEMILEFFTPVWRKLLGNRKAAFAIQLAKYLMAPPS